MTSSHSAINFIALPGQGFVPAGVLEHFPLERRSTFRYGSKYLLRPDAIPLDPVRIPLGETLFQTTPEQSMFNVFRDAAPDKWGRRVLSVMAGARAETMTEFEVLTAMNPESRIGGLAFGPDPFSNPKPMAPWYNAEVLSKTSQDLASIAEYVLILEQTRDEDLTDFTVETPSDDFLKAMATSLSPVGGARPKALVSHGRALWLAKFPKRGDPWNEPVVEHATMSLAGQCGITVPETRILTLAGLDLLLVRRFARGVGDEPRHMASAFTIGDLAEDGDWKSYQHLAQQARRLGAVDIGEQLFRRMVFNILCSNTDDHPRNHAFFIHRNRIALTPAFDIAPNHFRLERYELALGCGSRGREATLDNALSDTGPFGLKQGEASAIVRDMRNRFQGWREYFAAKGVSSSDMSELELRFIQS